MNVSLGRASIAGLAALGIIGGGVVVADATIPDADNGKIFACYKKDTGKLRVIDQDAGEGCSSKERKIKWNAKGRQGDMGPQGETGPRGDTGPAGGAGSFYETSKAPTYDYDRTQVTVTSECNGDDKAISANTRIPSNNHAELVRSEKVAGGWELFVRYDPNWGLDTPSVTAICVS